MAQPLLAWINAADDATVTAGSEAASLPAVNLQNAQLTTRWRSDLQTTTWLGIDFGAAMEVGVLALIDTNLTSAATMRLRLSNVSIGGGDLLDTGTVAAGVNDRYRSLFYVPAAPITARYGRLDLSDAEAVKVNEKGKTSAAGYLQAGRLFAGAAFRPQRCISYGWGVSQVDQSTTDRSLGGQLFVDVNAQYRALSFQLEYLTEAEAMLQALEMDRQVGIHGDVLMMKDPAGAYVGETSIWGVLRDATLLGQTAKPTFSKPYVILERK